VLEFFRTFIKKLFKQELQLIFATVDVNIEKTERKKESIYPEILKYLIF